MSSAILSVENISKRYRLGVINTGTFYEDLNRWWARRLGKVDQYRKINDSAHKNLIGDSVWALKDINFSVNKGEALGIIGRNGAGKSTLLKILSRVTAPTTGVVKSNGMISSLLEVGTGFHPELTGRENVYLNGAILGMTRAEVTSKFDEIVDFSGIELYIDTPVKRYSSGMYVRLAFAVAAHLSPEILIVDEVLAVGDAEFQKKCLGKMNDVASVGRTVLFVSHNMDAIQKLCSRVMLLEDGHLTIDDTDVKMVIDSYLSRGTTDASGIWVNSGDEYENKWFMPMRVTLNNQNGEVITGPVRNDEQIFLKIGGEVRLESRNITIGYYCYSDKSNYPVYLSQHDDGQQDEWPKLNKGHNILTTTIPKDILNVGKYYVKPYILLRSGQSSKTVIIDQNDNKVVVSFSISSVANESPDWMKRGGVIAPVLTWWDDHNKN